MTKKGKYLVLVDFKIQTSHCLKIVIVGFFKSFDSQILSLNFLSCDFCGHRLVVFGFEVPYFHSTAIFVF